MKIEIELPKLTPMQLAEMFWEMNSDEMAQFFGFVGSCALSSKGGYAAFDMQICWMSQSEKLTPNGARVMEMIGAFVEGKRLQPLA